MMIDLLRHRRPAAFWIACLTLALAGLVTTTASAQPTVNGLFFGDGDNTLYNPYSTSVGGSVLYSYLDAGTTTLYVALVVNHAVNDMVCSPKDNKAYTGSAGWGGHRSCKRASDSEFATFSLECAPNSANAWTWQQALGCAQNLADPNSNWVSNSTCGPSSPAADWPPGVEANSTSSWVANVNTYQNAATPRGWNLYAFGTGLDGGWKSPFLASAPNDVTQVPGYPTYSGSNYQWEWSMVYEWAVDLGPGGADCGGEAIFFLSGVSHHSPPKSGAENDPFNPPPSGSIFSDWGDNPDSYATTNAAGGARHHITVTGPYLGSQLQSEADGSPTADASGDGSEEDGVTANVTGNWTAGSTQSIDVVVSNADSGAVLAGWFDWNGDGDFDDAGEYFTWNVTTGTDTLSLTVGSGFSWDTDDLYTRFRIFSSGAAAPDGSLTQADFAGTATDGEVEDYHFEIGALPVTLNAFSSESARGGMTTVRWQTASETDNVGFEIWGLVAGEWQPLTELIPSHTLSSGLPQTYETEFQAPPGLAAIELVDYDSRGRQERFGRFAVDRAYGELQPVRAIDWDGPRGERDERLGERGFADLAKAKGTPAARWKKVRSGEPVRGAAARQPLALSIATPAVGRLGHLTAAASVEVASAALTHVAVTESGIQRVTYEALRDGGLDLAGVHAKDVAVTWRGAPVARWIDGGNKLGPGSAIEFVGHPPQGDDALYVDAALYQVSVDRSRAREAQSLGQGKAKNVSSSYLRTSRVDRQLLYRSQSPTGDPWVQSNPLVRPGNGTVVTLDLPVDGPVADGSGRLTVGLGTISDLPDQRSASGAFVPEHNVEVWLRDPGGNATRVADGSAFGQSDWTIEAALPPGTLSTGLHKVELRFTTSYFFSLVVIDDYAVAYRTPYRGPSLDFAPDDSASGYRIEGLTGADPAAYAEGADGSLTRLAPRSQPAGGGWAAELRAVDAAHYWVSEAPHAPQVFTTAAPSPDLWAGPADLVVVAESSFIGTTALDDYLAQHADLSPIVVDVEDVYNAVGFGMATPSAITDYLAARDAVHPFSHVQLVGSDCYDRLGHVSQCISFIPLPTAPVGVNLFTPSQNRLVDLDGDGVGDKAVGQFSVRSESELATIVAKGDAWRSSGLSAERSALFVAEETDGQNSFSSQVSRLDGLLGWSGAEVLDLAGHPQIQTARDAFRQSLEEGRALTLFSGHSSPTVWAFRALLTTGTAAALSNQGKPTLMVPLACETTYDVSPSANVLGHQLLYAGDQGAVAISGAVALSSLAENELMANHVLGGLDAGLTLGEAVQQGREALGSSRQELLDNWLTQGDAALGMER